MCRTKAYPKIFIPHWRKKMRWFKHLSNAGSDEKIARLIDLAGMEGYGAYWRILEIIAAQVERDSPKCEIYLSLTSLSHLLYSHHNKVGKWLVAMGVSGLLIVSKEEVGKGVNYRLTCPNLLKYRDEWTARKGKTRESVGSKSGATPERTDIDTDTYVAPAVEPPTAPLPMGADTRADSYSDHSGLVEALGRHSMKPTEMVLWNNLKKLGCTIEDVKKAFAQCGKNNLAYLENKICENKEIRIRSSAPKELDLDEYFGGQAWDGKKAN